MSGESEKKTRRMRIDPRLMAARWEREQYQSGKPLTEYGRAAVTEYETVAGPADYALCDAGQVIGVVEAKKLARGPQEVLPVEAILPRPR